MKHWAIIDKATGEHHFAVTEPDKHPRDCGYSAKAHKFVALDREPCEHDTFNGKTLSQCKQTKARIERGAQFNRMTRLELVQFIETLVEQTVDARLAAMKDDNENLSNPT